MYKVNLALRTIISLILLLIVLFINNYYLFWLLLFYMLLLSIVDRNYKSLLVNFAIVLVLLFCYYNSKIKFILKALFIINILITYFCSFGTNEKKNIIYRSMYNDSAKSRKRLFYNNYLARVNDINKEKAFTIYGENISIDDKVLRDMNNLYVHARTRFYGYSNKITNFDNKWTWYDTIFLVVAISIIILMCVYW